MLSLLGLVLPRSAVCYLSRSIIISHSEVLVLWFASSNSSEASSTAHLHHAHIPTCLWVSVLHLTSSTSLSGRKTVAIAILKAARQARCRVAAGVKLPHVAEPQGEAYSQAVSTLLPYLLSHRSRLAAFAAATAGAAAPTASQAQAADPQAQSAAQRSDFAAASEAADSYSASAEEAELPDSPMHSQPQEFLASLQPEQRHRLAVLVDTAILKVMH